MRKSLLLLTIFCALCFLELSAQVKTNFRNSTLITGKGKYGRDYKMAVYRIAPPDTNAIKQRELQDKKGAVVKPFRFAEPVPVNINVAKLIQWNEDGKFAFGRFSISAKGARSLSINFNDFYLPEGTELFIYNEDGSMITGPVTEKENTKKAVWGSAVYKGEVLIVEVKTPLITKSDIRLNVNNVAYGYKEIFGFGNSAACNINVLCPQGTGWEQERNAVALILDGLGTILCSGALVANTCDLNLPYFLTANHCLVGDVTQWRFIFQYWSATCAPSQDDFTSLLFNGSTLRANSAATDFALLELNNAPDANSGLAYAGWSRNTTGITQTTIIHHPAGDVMKISRDNNAPTAVNVGVQAWQVVLDEGTTNGGSSGAPYFNQDHRIIAQHLGTANNHPDACVDLTKFGGRFDLSWAGGGTNATGLRNWLDPYWRFLLTTNTTPVANLPAPAGPATASVTASLASGPGEPTVYGFTATPMTCVTYNWYRNNVLQASTLDNYYETYIPCGMAATVKCTVTNWYGTSGFSNSVRRTGGCDRGRIALTPNPAASNVVITSGNATTFDVVRIYDFQGNLKLQKKYNKAKSATINITGLNNGTYFVEIISGTEKERQPLLIKK
ncbi:T9SS type A sorting domain-containing protein [Pseudoflavitalea sp. X16]|uniref:T9SS type A sorting domain-containing protein n=1 Tax=Paraflavitalea devenefica TaxID=2716334 RepID=UPI0014225BC2|nr:T9SS type A sorting domain-containing protein [Paraflavitalea devenefica]NII26067.1 T9SS type A sorting domain-containing protein [Paraflavitalea devenefica]